MSSPSVPDQIKQAVAAEHLRAQLVASGQFKAARQTYDRQRVFLPDSNTGEFWDEQFARSDAVFPMERWRLETVVQALDLQKSILNLGVGRGVLEEMLVAKAGGATLDYLGTDITAATLTQLRQRFPNLQFQQLDLTALKPHQRQFDQVVLLEVLEHIRPDQTFAVLQHCYALTKPGGRFIISVPLNEGLEEMLPINPNSHQRMYTPEVLQFELKEVGFKVEEVHLTSAFSNWFGLKHWLNSWLHRWQPNNVVLVCGK